MTTSDNPITRGFEALKQRAKELVRAARAGDPAAIGRLRSVPRLSGCDDAALAKAAKLADAQHALAREHGCESWPKLKKQVEDAQPAAVLAEMFLAAIRGQKGGSALRIFDQHPEIARLNILTASAAGDAAVVGALLAADPRFANARQAKTNWTPLMFAAASPLWAPRAAQGATSGGTGGDRTAGASEDNGLVVCARLLLDAGADPNSHTIETDEDGAENPLTALYHACVSGNVGMVRLLLERGAKPNDGESVYHSAELNRRECLDLLLAHGADISGAQSARRNTPLYFLSCYQESHAGLEASVEGMRWLLEHGADPNVPSGEVRETPLHRVAAQGRSVAVAEMLLAHGADPNRERADGRAPYVLAVRTGNTRVADCLRAHGAGTNSVTPLDELLGACMRGDGAAARALVKGHPGLMASLPDADRTVVVHAVYQKKPEALRVMAEMGFDLAWEGEWGGTPLHHAAWLGLVEMVRALLLLGAPVNVRDGRYGSSPLGWGAHGSHHCREADDDYIKIVDLLLDAGSDRETSINKWGEAPETLGSRRVDAHLKARLRARPNEH